ncbi:MAG: hypothetical protein J6Y33_03150 [Prevotella sp.]|nr:hypothetical protein [Prevotella sp.]
MEKNYKVPPIVWLKMTDYMHGWLQWELGGASRIKDQRVLSVQHLPGARDILRMESFEDLMMDPAEVGNAMSAARRNCLSAGMDIDAGLIEREYGLTKDGLKLFVPVECPRNCLTKQGVLRPWTLNVSFSARQATAMQRLLRQTFWDGVAEYDAAYARNTNGRRYPAIEMIEAFCKDTGTSEVYAEAIKREWQRRVKRGKAND